MKRLLAWAGNILVILGVLFIAIKFNEYFNMLKGKFNFTVKDFAFFTVIAIGYCISNLLLVAAWRNILKSAGFNVRFSLALKIYSGSQLAKYIPGNIMHLTGRQVLAMRYKFPGLVVLKSIGSELSLLIVAGGLFCTFYIQYLIPSISVYVTFLIFLFSLVLVVLILRWLSKPFIIFALLEQCLFLVLSGLFFYIILNYFDAGNGPVVQSVYVVVSGYIIAWLIGLVTPGAPAGIGIRETVLVFLLHNYAPSSILLAVILGRATTVIGDGLFYLFSLFIGEGPYEAKA